jgi:hypothetical protein
LKAAVGDVDLEESGLEGSIDGKDSSSLKSSRFETREMGVTPRGDIGS